MTFSYKTYCSTTLAVVEDRVRETSLTSFTTVAVYPVSRFTLEQTQASILKKYCYFTTYVTLVSLFSYVEVELTYKITLVSLNTIPVPTSSVVLSAKRLRTRR